MLIELGAKVKDKITGLKGTATGRAVYLNGCVQILIEPPVLREGDPYREIWMDEGRLEQVKNRKLAKKKAVKKKVGGPCSAPPPRSGGRG